MANETPKAPEAPKATKKQDTRIPQNQEKWLRAEAAAGAGASRDAIFDLYHKYGGLTKDDKSLINQMGIPSKV